ncbi:MAG: transketolase, partial [Halobacteriovoraceae bacterium]|nr:transketolase [Halobacteriovoraceae bacterium]
MPNSLTPLKLACKLAPTPKGPLKYPVTVKNKESADEQLADPKASRALVALMNQHAVIGGAAAHWGGPAGFAEIMSSIHAVMFRESDWHQSYNFINDAGHAENGIYALRANYGFDGLDFEALKGFRGIESKLTGHGEAHLNPEGVFISNGPLGSGVPQAQGLALADQILGNDRVTVCAVSDGASMEGEAKEAFAAIPGLAAKEKLNPFVLLISDNNTKLSGRISEDSFDMSPTFKSLEALGWQVIVEEEGHNLQKVHNQVESALNKAKADPTRAVAVIFKTIKGYGVRATEESASGGHGYPLKAYDPKLVEFIQEIYN